MIERIIEFSIRRRWIVILAAVVLAVWGIRAAYQTPVDAIPDLSENQVIVFTDWPGHGPREIEDQVTYPLALELRGLAKVRVVRSSSDVGFSMISVIFEDSAGWEAARRHVSEALARAAPKLPPGVAPRLAPDADATGQIFWYTVEGPGYDPGRLRAVQDWFVRPQLAAVPGVAEVASVGGMPIEYQVDLDPHKSKALLVAPSQVVEAVSRANAAAGGNVVHMGNAEFVVRSVGWLGARAYASHSDPQRICRDLESIPLLGADGTKLRLADVATVGLGSQPRRCVLEKDGNEACGGVVLMRHGENPRAVTRRLRQKIEELQAGLPPRVRILPFYDRTPLIDGAVGAVTTTLIEAILVAALCIFIVLLHVRTSFIIALTLPLAILISFGLMDALRRLGIADVQTNIMSLAGLAISVGVLVDSSIVMAENAMHHLKTGFGDRKVRGDTRELVLPACRTVGRPIFFSIVIMLLSFLPVFALGGLEGKLFHPLAFTKSFALVGVGLLAITLVPALCTFFVKGRLRSEEQVGLVAGLMRVYRPVLTYFLDRPVGLVWFVGLTLLFGLPPFVTLILGLAPAGNRIVLLALLALFVVATVLLAKSRAGKLAAGLTLVLAALVAEQRMVLGREFVTPLDEGMIMDMPITVPRASVTQSAGDLKARDMVFCRFPEVDMVVGKAGRAETAFDPAPLDMIETMINFRPREFWPKRCLKAGDAERQARAVLHALVERQIIRPPNDSLARANEAALTAVALFDAQMREAAYQRNKECQGKLGRQLVSFATSRLVALLQANGSLRKAGGSARLPDSRFTEHATYLAMEPSQEAVAALAADVIRFLTDKGQIEAGADPLQLQPNVLERGLWSVHQALGGERPTLISRLHAEVRSQYQALWRRHVRELDTELLERAAGLYTRLVLEVLLKDAVILDERVVEAMAEWQRVRTTTVPAANHVEGHPHGGRPLPWLDPVPVLDSLQTSLSERFGRGLLLWQRDRAELAGFGGELDRAMQMPGWTNVWTMPIQNRVDMLSTGVNTTIGVRVLGRRLDDVVQASEDIARVLKTLPGAADVIADPVRGKGYLEVYPDREKLSKLGVNPGTINDLVEIAQGGKIATTTVEGRQRHPVRVSYARAFREDAESLGGLPVLVTAATNEEAGKGIEEKVAGNPPDTTHHSQLTTHQCFHVPLAAVADIRVTEGPATIKGENGLLRNYVRLNVRGRDAGEFVAAAKQAISSGVSLPPGVLVEWTGQFEHEARTRQTLQAVWPLVLVLIFVILWWTYGDLADALLMFLTVPGAIAGGVFFQWLFGYPFSATVWIGYIACLGMATSTGIIMLVYLREAVDKAGGLENLTLGQLREAVLQGAVHRLRPKILTEAVTILGLAPLLWASGPGADVLRPMVIPVLGGILLADEVIDLFLPVLFYQVRRRRWQRRQASKAPAIHEPVPA
jgi:Cu(I)/Ag(I) efflux system membrane protein CusA/SilA